MAERTYSTEEVARRGDEIYERRVRPNVDEEADKGKYVVIDVKTEDYEVDTDEMAAADRLDARHPELKKQGQRVWLTRVGSRYARRFGGRPYRAE